ncbi:hypothetical protein EB796_021419 [Bugula neritina]|uniref:Uncharacterized protein n=1 Tax=Bugula neritina TaxID=10212 RepID=A0A7J7J4E2_BUGNE|nr:hypothetical protein EB796_021419 [Bugula neritina]
MEREKDLMMMENEELRNKLCCAEREMGLRNKIELAIGRNYIKNIKRENKGLKAQVNYLQQVKVCLFLLTLLFG